jgi:hypothetical protein
VRAKFVDSWRRGDQVADRFAIFDLWVVGDNVKSIFFFNFKEQTTRRNQKVHAPLIDSFATNRRRRPDIY